MPFGIQPIHIFLIIIVALLLFGPKRLPEMGRNIGKAISEFRNGTKEITDSLHADGSASREAGATPASPPTQSVPFQGNSIAPAFAPSATPPPASSPEQPTPFQAAASASAPAGNFCIQCGAGNPPEARFCNSCGTKLPEKAA